MINYTKFNLLVRSILFVSFLSCTSSAQEKSPITVTENKEVSADTAWFNALKNTTPLTGEELLALLPEELSGLPIVAKNTNKDGSVRVTYSNEAKPSIRNKSIHLEIVDGAAKISREHITETLNILSKEDMSQTFKNSWGKTTTYQGFRVLVKETQREASGTIPPRVSSEVECLKNNRFHIILQGNFIESNALLKSAEKIQALPFPK